MRIYLDNAASTPIREEVIEAMTGVMRDLHGNPSSIHAHGRKARAKIEESRKKIAGYLNASIGEIFFTSGGTESSNMAIKGAVRDLGVQRFITTKLEHPCVSNSLAAAEKMGASLEYLDVDDLGRPDYEQLEKKLQENEGVKTLVTLMHANNEIGTLSDMARISQLCEKYGAYYHSDTVQTMAHLPIDVSKTKIHFLSGGAHKFHGPKGCGFIYINSETQIKPMMDGGSQERNMRGGTENIYGIVGMAKAMELACENMEEYRQHMERLRDYLKENLMARFEDIQFIGDQESYLYTFLNVSFPPSEKSEMLLLLLDIAGISASGGSACSSGVEGGSHVLNAIGADPARKSIRFSFSHFTTKGEIDFVLEKLAEIVKIKEAVIA